jgi:DNA modification methylase
LKSKITIFIVKLTIICYNYFKILYVKESVVMYKYTDYLGIYGRIMQFNKNKFEPFHRWYPFVEGYSKEFIQSIIEEIEETPNVCLEPFSGSGTTALELQNMGITCYSFEVNPLMHLISKVKLENNYEEVNLIKWFDYIVKNRKNWTTDCLDSPFRTLYQKVGLTKWNYDEKIYQTIQKLKSIIDSISDSIYKDLFTVALASILLDVSNLYRNGKCLSYKKNWKDRVINEEEIFEKFDKKVKTELFEDIIKNKRETKINNKDSLFHEDSRIGIRNYIADESVDLVITSPPYLNSRDYTDTYMLELKTLGFMHSNEEIRNLREKTLRSHVQIKWKDKTGINNPYLIKTLKDLEVAADNKIMWNNSLIDMVRLYFVDIKEIFQGLYKKLKKNGKVYFNVSNSAYFNVLINTLEICASIAEDEGFKIKEIRKARYLKTSPQQQSKIGKLLEGVIVMERS